MTSFNLKSKGVIVDIGSGDGKFAYKLAKKNPEKFVIGVDSSTKPLADVSRRIYRKPQKGGLPNVLFIRSAVEYLPEDLTAVANQVFVNFPWGSLLAGIVNVDERIWENIKRICKKGANIDIVFGYDGLKDKTEVDRLNLPQLSKNYIYNILPKKLFEMGMDTVRIQKLYSSLLKTYPSSWAKKLGFSDGRSCYHMRVKVL
ncbi:MAG: methyltransferase domain-containing protein [Patescibacteria group bacterium]|nr:methyltransferase domain-containing protein [Patescibacteria group bacterium]